MLGQCLCTGVLWVGASVASFEQRASAQKFAWAREKQGTGWVSFMGRPSSVSWWEGVVVSLRWVRIGALCCIHLNNGVEDIMDRDTLRSGRG